VRLFLLSDVAGALEPCGCTQDQLGGLGHFGAWIQRARAQARVEMIAAAGPLFFMDPKLDTERADQDRAKAETLAQVLRDLDLVAFAPGTNDWAAGGDALAHLTQVTGGAALGPPDVSPFTVSVVRPVAGSNLKVGFVGVGQLPPDAAARSPGEGAEALVRRGVDQAKAQGATVLVALAAVGRGQAKRIADAVPELTAVVVGSPQSSGEANTSSPQPERVGDVLIVQAANHLQTVSVLDLYVRDGAGGAPPGRTITFADGTGLELASRREDLTRRIDDLHIKIAAWEREGTVGSADLLARRADLARLEAERAALDERPAPPSGSFFRYSVKEVRESMGKDPLIEDAMKAYYQHVNERNRIEFADRMPPPVAEGQASYVGVDACSGCHPGPRQVWNATRHAKAYPTLAQQYKEFNLDCVSCHVTGYEKPGGSTVAHVEKLQSVQCEVCHGPGSKHALDPSNPALIVARPSLSTCLGCHHSPHVEGFDPAARLKDILGPGHGQPAR
jgi:hypothetical protein